MLGDRPEDDGKLDGAEHQEHERDADSERQVGDPVDDHCLDGRGAGARPVVPVADQQVAHEPDALPAEEQLQEVVGRHQHQHHEGEQVEIGEEPIARVGVVRHVADAVDVDEGGDERHHSDHHGRKRVVAKRPAHVKQPAFDPVAEIDNARGTALQAHRDKARNPTRSGDHHHKNGHRLRRPVADRTAGEARDDRAQQRGEHGNRVDHPQPLIRFTSST